MPSFGFTFGLSPREPIGRFADLSKIAESVGFQMGWIADSQLYTKNPFVALTLSAVQTKSLLLGPGVTNPLTRHPTVLANSMAALQEVSGNRMILGLGAGDASVTPLGLGHPSLLELEKAIAAIRSIAHSKQIATSSHKLSVPIGGFGIEIFLSASQAGMLKLAGRCADGVILMGAANVELVQWQLDRIQEGAEQAHRSLEDITIDLWFSISMKDDIRDATKDVRPWALSQARSFYRWKELPKPLSSFAHEFASAEHAHSFDRHLSREEGPDEMSAVTDEFVQWVGVVGAPDECRSRLKQLASLKVDRFTLAILPGGRESRIRQYGQSLIGTV